MISELCMERSEKGIRGRPGERTVYTCPRFEELDVRGFWPKTDMFFCDNIRCMFQIWMVRVYGEEKV